MRQATERDQLVAAKAAALARGAPVVAVNNLFIQLGMAIVRRASAASKGGAQ